MLGHSLVGPPHPDKIRRLLEAPGAELERSEELRRQRGTVRLAAAVGIRASETLVDAVAKKARQGRG
ncbi:MULTISPECIES: hypothetical protein [Streptomyces]|uniref:Uncharacterized protein n=1 Tax=Streptomyces milbemycinicus TaxID=476552 RepID=A0ABW8M511_9ACTN|nr:hypothetical protein [Streptomyces hygroscopicus]